MTSRSVFPLRVAAIVLTAVGILPLAMLIKFAPVVEWVPVAAVEWTVAMLLLGGLCLAVAHRLGWPVRRIGAHMSRLAPEISPGASRLCAVPVINTRTSW